MYLSKIVYNKFDVSALDFMIHQLKDIINRCGKKIIFLAYFSLDNPRSSNYV
jgi:hypothetical protein